MKGFKILTCRSSWSIVDGVAFPRESVHDVCSRIRSAWLRYRLSKQANGVGLSPDLRVEFPLVPVAVCPLGHDDCSGCSARVARYPVYDDGETVIKSSLAGRDLPDYLCECAIRVK